MSYQNGFGNKVVVQKLSNCVRVNVQSLNEQATDIALRSQANNAARKALFWMPTVHSVRVGDIAMVGNGQRIGRWMEVTYLERKR